MNKLIYVIGLTFACNLAASGGDIPYPTDAQLKRTAERMYLHLSPQLTKQGLTDREAAITSYKSILRMTTLNLRAQKIHPTKATLEQACNAFWQPFNNSKYGKAIKNLSVIETKQRNPRTLMILLHQPVTKS